MTLGHLTAEPLSVLRPPRGRCLGAVFATHSLDESFFETVLAAVLPIHADRTADPRVFLGEARRRLRESPVFVMADARGYSGGHRLPYQVQLMDPDVGFCARLALVLAADHARLVVGSANLTQASFGSNAEMGALMTLDYQRDSGQLRAVLDTLAQCGASGEAWERFVRQCAVLMPAKSSKVPPWPRLLVSREESVLAQFLSGIPKQAKVQAMHLLVPAQPSEDSADGVAALEPLQHWAKKRARDVPLNVVAAWPEPRLTAPEAPVAPAAGRLWAELPAEMAAHGAEQPSFTPIERVKDGAVALAGRARPIVARAATKALQGTPPRAWVVDEVVGAGLLDPAEPLGDERPLTWWLFPEQHRRMGALQRRPLHGRFLAICTREQSKSFTHVLVGGPNLVASSGLLQEAGLHLRIDGAVSITALCPELIPAPSEEFYLEERSWAAAGAAPRPPLHAATYDAKTQQLLLEWHTQTPACRVYYQRETGEEELFKGKPSLRTVLPHFVLAPGCAELHVHWEASHQALVPINVTNIAHLWADEPDDGYDLAALVHFHNKKGPGQASNVPLHAPDIFAAQDALVSELFATGNLVGAFEVVLDGPLGLRTFIDRLLDGTACAPAEAFVYGLELYKLLRSHDTGKESRIGPVLDELHTRIQGLAPNAPWTQQMLKLYGEAS